MQYTCYLCYLCNTLQVNINTFNNKINLISGGKNTEELHVSELL